MLDNKAKQTLLGIAQQSIEYGLQHGRSLPLTPSDFSDNLRIKQASFVTLTTNNQLRGCIGSLVPQRALVEDVAENAFAAAFRDPRFTPLTTSEFPALHYHISILSPTEPITFDSESDLLNKIRPGVDGLVLTEEGRRATFLPSVWESLPDKSKFLQQLKLKAGLPTDYWSEKIKVDRYTVEDIESTS